MARQSKGRRKPPNAVQQAITRANRRISAANKRHGTSYKLIDKSIEPTLVGGQRAQAVRNLNRLTAAQLKPTVNSLGAVAPNITHNWFRSEGLELSPRQAGNVDLNYFVSPAGAQTATWNRNMRAKLENLEAEGVLPKGMSKTIPDFNTNEARRIYNYEERYGASDFFQTVYDLELAYDLSPEEAAVEVREVIERMLKLR